MLQKTDDSAEINESQDKVKVAILDSGIDFSENINVVERKNFMDDEVSPLYEDNTGHGTAIAGIIASSGKDGMVKGVNPNVEIYSARILDEDNKAPISRVVESIYWAIEEDVDIVNISFGTTVNSEILHNAIKDATDAGILVFAASGNQGENEGSTVEYPAAYEEVVAVGATNPDGKVADMTSTGEELDIVAPGINIHSVGWLDMEVVCNGTSMAVPHAVGAASLLWETDKDKPADFIKGLLEASAKTVEEDGEEYSFIDVEYAKEIYDEYCEKYKASEDVDGLNEVYENDEEVEAYDETVTGSWSRDDHAETVNYASDHSGGLTATDVSIVKVGVRAPDKWYSADVYDGTDKNPWGLNLKMFHAKDDFNYVKVYEYIMNMAVKCRDKGIAAAQSMNYPNNDPGVYGECATVKNQLNLNCITNILNGSTLPKSAYDADGKKRRARALIMLGFAMHVVGNTYAHRAGVKVGNEWISLQLAGYTNDKKKHYETRWDCAQESCAEILAVWNGDGASSYLEFDMSKADGKFRLNKFKTYCLAADGEWVNQSYVSKRSYGD